MDLVPRSQDAPITLSSATAAAAALTGCRSDMDDPLVSHRGRVGLRLGGAGLGVTPRPRRQGQHEQEGEQEHADLEPQPALHPTREVAPPPPATRSPAPPL